MQYLAVGLYLAAIVAANLLVTVFGPGASIILAFVFIALDLTLRDYLHELWHHKNLPLKMGLLILAGSVLSYLINQSSGPIALASCVAFGAAALVDTLVYGLAQRYPWLVKVNLSNVFSSATDSFIFPTLAFGGFLWPVVLGQFLAKFLGGLFWSGVIFGVKSLRVSKV